MTAPFNTAGGYGSPVINQDGAALVDTQDGNPVVAPSLTPSSGALSQAVVSAVASPDAALPELNAILVELRVHTNLLLLQLGAAAPDVEQMRADELWNTTPGSGVV